jgi:bis(5'-nucleosidyl)-tetraphosphatase
VSTLKNERSSGAILFAGSRENALFLLLKHKKNGHWSFPKGHIEEGEDEVDCATREITEETGISKQQLEFILDFQRTIDYVHKSREGEDIHKEATYLLAAVPSPISVALSDEHSEYVWASLSQALELLKYENIRWVLNSANRHIIRTQGLDKKDHIVSGIDQEKVAS